MAESGAEAREHSDGGHQQSLLGDDVDQTVDGKLPETKSPPNEEQVPPPGPMESEGSEPRAKQKPASPGRRQRAAKRRSTPRADETLDEGADLERRVGRVEFAEGALVRLRVPLRVGKEAGKDVVTDIDVLAVDLDLRLRPSRSILECKSSHTSGGEADRLFWLAGLQDFVGADRAVLVRQTVSGRGRTIASSLGLHILDMRQLESREAAHAWLPERFGHLGGAGCTAAEKRMTTQLKGLANIPSEQVAFVCYEAALAAPNRIVAALHGLGESVAGAGPIPEPTGTVLAGHSLVALLVAATIDAQTLDVLPKSQVERRLELTLTVGGPQDEALLDLFASTDAIVQHLTERVHQAYQDAGVGRRDVSLPTLRDLIAQPPSWIPRYMDLLEEVRSNPAIARDLPQTAELACFDALMGDSAYLSAAFDHLFTAEHRGLLRVAVRTLKAIIGGELADRLGTGFAALNFDRSAPALPDRRSAPAPEISSSRTALEPNHEP
jgi:hypothetical protein